MIYYGEGGWYLPEGEKHLQGWMREMWQLVGPPSEYRLGYQHHKYEAALKYVKQRRVAIDVGAHVGLWSWPMSFDFDRLESFEPMPAHRECFVANTADRTNINLWEFALGQAQGNAIMCTRTRGSSGDTGVELTPKEGAEKVPMLTLDSFGFDDVDFIKVDCEGYEIFVLQGATETLERCKPCVIVEQKPSTGMQERYGIGETDAVEFLNSLGAKVRAVISGDYILSWD